MEQRWRTSACRDEFWLHARVMASIAALIGVAIWLLA